MQHNMLMLRGKNCSCTDFSLCHPRLLTPALRSLLRVG
jgi:hypothetical protein